MECSIAVFIFSVYICAVVKEDLRQTVTRQKMQLTAPGYLYSVNLSDPCCFVQRSQFAIVRSLDIRASVKSLKQHVSFLPRI